MELRPYRVLLWTGLLLLAGELSLELRAALRGWSPPLLAPFVGSPVQPRLEGDWGPLVDFPFRSRPIPRERRPGVPRVWIASSSYAEDLEHEPEELFPNVLVDVLAEQGRVVEVVNASRSGTYIGSNLRALEELAPQWRPDVAVLYQMSNDIDLISESLAAPSTRFGPRTRARSLGDETRDVVQKLRPVRSGRTSAFVESMISQRLLAKLLTARLARARVLKDSLGDDGRLRYAALVRLFVEGARAQGIEPVLCTFATRTKRSEAAEAGTEAELKVLSINVQLSLTGWLQTVDDFNEVVRGVARSERLRLIDVASELTGRREMFSDMWHFSAAGHRRVAELLAAGLFEGPQ